MKKYHKKNKFRKLKIKKSIIIFIIFIYCFIVSIGYGFFSTTLTISGKVSAHGFSITYILNGGTNAQDPVAFYNGTTSEVLPIPTYNGYTFGGWFEEYDFSGTALTTTPTRKQCT